MSDLEPELEQNPYMRSFYNNPPPPASRPINTNRGPNPYESDRGTRHVYDQSRLGTYSRHSEADMMRLSQRANSDLVAAATGPPPFPKARTRQTPVGPSPLGNNRRAENGVYFESPQKSAKSNKRRYTERDSSSELSEHDDDDFSPALKRRLAATPLKLRKTHASSGKRKTPRNVSDDEDTEELRDESWEIDKDAEEEEALERVLTRRAAEGYTSPIYETSTSKRRKPGPPNTPMSGIYYRTPVLRYSSPNSLIKKPKGKPVPQELKDADAADRMMWRWKTKGRPWEEIREEYYRLSGTKPAASSLSVRYIKLGENLAANGLKDEIHDSYFDTYPARKYLKTYTKPEKQEVALTKAVVDAKIKTSSTLWKEVVVQMKASTGETFAPSSLRKRYEEIENRQFYISEQDPAKYSQWPALPRGRRVKFDSTPELVPVALGSYDMTDHAHGHSGGGRNMSVDMANDSLSTDGSAEDAEYESFDTANGNDRSMTDSKGKCASTRGKSRSTIEKENESPSHTHPRISYGKASYNSELESSKSMGKILSTPTPAAGMGKASVGTGIGGLVGYGDSDDSDDSG